MLSSEIPTLDRLGLRNFGLTTGAIVIVLFGLLVPWIFSYSLPLWPWILALVLAALAVTVPMTLNPVYKVWMKFGLVLGFINTRIILFLLFYVIFFPTGLIMKVIRFDPMARKLARGKEGSYRVVSKERNKDHFERPY